MYIRKFTTTVVNFVSEPVQFHSISEVNVPVFMAKFCEFISALQCSDSLLVHTAVLVCTNNSDDLISPFRFSVNPELLQLHEVGVIEYY